MEDEDKKAEVIQLKNDYESVALLKTLIKKLENDEIDSMVIMAYEQRDDVEGGTGRIYRHWFSQNKIGCLQTLSSFGMGSEASMREARTWSKSSGPSARGQR